jgi:hypothetical protein
MIEHLAVLIDTFPGAANQTRCFAHILNLVAKSVLRQFEAPKVKGKKAVDEAANTVNLARPGFHLFICGNEVFIQF